MNFALPTSPVDDEWGFHKERCAHWEKKEIKTIESAPIVYGIRGIVGRKAA